MVQINFAQKQVNAKIVYYGPGMSGKTTNLEIIHQRAPKANRGELTSISTDGDRTLFFDFMPLDLGTVAGMRTCFQIYTVPGQVYYNSTRKLVLQGVDGVIFVADSSASMTEENLESLRNLEQNLAEYGRGVDDVAVVIQYNKRDLPDAMSVEDLNAQMNPRGVPSFEGVAHTGQGVFPTLKALAACVIENIHNQQRAALSPAGGGNNRRPTRNVAEAAPEAAQPQAAQPQAAQPQMVAADAPAAPLPTRAEPAPIPAAMAAAQAPVQQPEPQAAAPAPASMGGLRLAEPQSTPDSRAAAQAAKTAQGPGGAPPLEQPPPRPRRQAQQEAPAPPAKRPAQRPAGKQAQRPAGKQAQRGGNGKAAPRGGKAGKAQPRREAQSGQGRRGGQSAQERRRSTPRPTPVQQKGSRSTVLTAVIVIASVGIGAVLGSLVLGAL